MARLIVYYAHPGQRFSKANQAMAQEARSIADLTFVDLYAEYPRHDIDVEREQQRLLDHDVILFQFPLYWYSTPSLIKEWQDLVLQYGFAYGQEGTRLAGKWLMLAVTAGGPEDAYSTGGYQNHPIRDFLVPLEQTAALCKMHFAAPYVLYGSLTASPETEIKEHAEGYATLLQAISQDRYDLEAAPNSGVITAAQLPIKEGV
jgi:putative NADPH-quinone reductase